MKSSPIFPRDHENASFNEVVYDPRVDFSKFLEEARKHSSDIKHESSFLPPSVTGNTFAAMEATKKTKKSWRRYLSLWLKLDKKSSAQQDATTTTTTKSSSVRNRKLSSFSGLIFGREGKAGAKFRKANSGPLSGCFTPTRAEENEVPYVWLDQQSCPSGVQAFGPIYLVT